jgi:hypothetical protein
MSGFVDFSLLPALKALRPQDWAEIALKPPGREDPFYQSGFGLKFSTLRRSILKMEEEVQAEGPD